MVATNVGEEWRDIPGFIGTYQASSLGRVRTLARTRGGLPIVMKPRENVKGYLVFGVVVDGSRRMRFVSRAVLSAFRGNPASPDMHADHLDGDRTNNRLDNLEWVTCTENNRRRLTRHGGAPWRRGTLNPMTTLNDVQVRVIRRCEERGCQVGWKQLLATSWGVSPQSVSDIAHGRRWQFTGPTRLHALVAAAQKVMGVKG